MRSRRLLVRIPLCFLALLGGRSDAAGPPRVEVSADRSAYVAGETATVTLRTWAGGPSDVFIVLTTPAGKRFYADQALQFRRWRAAAASNFVLEDGQVEVPVSLATSDLARPGEYLLEAYVSAPGGNLEAGALTGQAKFLVSLPGLNYLAIHNPDSPRYDSDCAACHVDKTRTVFLAPGVPSFHTIKYRMFSVGGVARPCAICHDGADLLDFSQAALRKSASPAFCAQCHGPFGPGKKLFAK